MSSSDILATKASFEKGSTLDIGRAPDTRQMAAITCFNHQSQQNCFLITKMLFNLSSTCLVKSHCL